MRKLIRYPARGMNYIHQGQFLVLLSTDIDKIVAALSAYSNIIVSKKRKLFSKISIFFIFFSTFFIFLAFSLNFFKVAKI